MLDYSQIEGGIFVLKEEVFNLSDFFASIIEICQPRAELEEVSIVQIIDKVVPLYITSDKERIEQILIHLLQNSIKYTGRKGKISILANLTTKGLKITVKDTGKGMTKEEQKNIFSQIFAVSEGFGKEEVKEEIVHELNIVRKRSRQLQVKYSTPKVIHAFGLQITQKLVESLNSKLKVKSMVNRGTEFSFILKNYDLQKPYKVPKYKSHSLLNLEQGLPRETDSFIENYDILSTRRRRSVNEEDFSNTKYDLDEIDKADEIKKKIDFYKNFNNRKLLMKINTKKLLFAKPSKKSLIVDDNGVNRIAITGLLKREGINTIEKNDGVEAVEEISNEIKNYRRDKNRQLLVDYIFMDLNMPNMDGKEATVEINKMLEAIGVHIPIFALTAYQSDHMKLHCLANGFAEFLIKPIKKDELLFVLNKYNSES